MILCTYKRFYSRDGNSFQECGTDKFKTDNKGEADLVISNWNRVGGRKNQLNTFYRYEIETTEDIDWNVWDNEDIPYRNGGIW
jgi:hypothetical protein